tara:strand:+ start:739 stop:1614 length:876 start_codon:yes stop_codon:yes gene_type:complete
MFNLNLLVILLLGYYYYYHIMMIGMPTLSMGFILMSFYNYIIKNDIRKSRGYLFFGLSGMSTILLAPPFFLCLPYVILFDYDDRKYMDKIQKIWARLITSCFYKTNVIGMDNILSLKNNPAVYISNHGSYLDAYTLLWLDNVRIKIILKKELMLIPVIGWVLGILGHIPFTRSNKKSRKNAIIECNKVLKTNNSIFVFPEGGRSRTGEIGEFKIGAFKLSYENNVPIVPIYIDGAHEMLKPSNNLSLGYGEITMTIYKPIYPNNYKSVGEFREKVRDFYLLKRQKKLIKNE